MKLKCLQKWIRKFIMLMDKFYLDEELNTYINFNHVLKVVMTLSTNILYIICIYFHHDSKAALKRAFLLSSKIIERKICWNLMSGIFCAWFCPSFIQLNHFFRFFFHLQNVIINYSMLNNLKLSHNKLTTREV